MVSVTEDAVIQTATSSFNSRYWLGMQYNDGSKNWSDSSIASSYTNWDVNQPSSSSVSCVYANVTVTSSYTTMNKWHTDYCDDRTLLSNRIVCEFSIFRRKYFFFMFIIYLSLL